MHRLTLRFLARFSGPSLTARHVRRVVIALMSVLVVFVILSQVAAEGKPARGLRVGFAAGSESLQADGSLFRECVALGLKPISTKLTLFFAGDSVVHIPTLKVSWSAKPLPRRCRMHTVVAVRARVRFPKTGHSLEFGPDQSSRWYVFWFGRTHVDNAERILSGPAVTFNVGCVEKPRGWLRYEVEGRGGRSLARLVRPVPVSSEICERSGRRSSPRRG
jgi:hypothetical protein